MKMIKLHKDDLSNIFGSKLSQAPQSKATVELLPLISVHIFQLEVEWRVDDKIEESTK